MMSAEEGRGVKTNSDQSKGGSENLGLIDGRSKIPKNELTSFTDGPRGSNPLQKQSERVAAVAVGCHSQVEQNVWNLSRIYQTQLCCCPFMDSLCYY